MKGFVLAAGLGTRLRPITESVPKPLLPVGNVPLIGYALRLLSHHGITEVIVNLHHLGKSIRESVGDGSQYGVQITYSEEEEILGTGGGLKKMHEALRDDTFVVINGDTVLDVNLEAAIEAHRHAGALATMVLREDPNQADYGQIEINGAGRIRRLLGQGEVPPGETVRPLMFAGVHILEPRFLEYIPPALNTCINRYAYTKALSNNEVLWSYVMDGYWTDAGTPDRYYRANADALERTMPLRHVNPLEGFAMEPKKEVAEVIRMGENVDLGANARLLPPVVLGNGAKVGDGAVVGPHVVVGARAVIGKEAKVTQSIVLEGAKLDANREYTRIIVGRKASLPIDGTPSG